jgi:hypothetical protein
VIARRKPVIERVAVIALTPGQIEQLWSCYSCYASTRREDFIDGLMAAHEVFMFRDPATGSLAGFHTLRPMTVRAGGRSYAILYANHADIEPDSRGLNLLQRIVVSQLLWLKLRNPFRPVYLMFTASTFTSYLLLPKNVAEYWPHPRQPTPAKMRDLMDCVMRTLEKEGWDAATGVIHRYGKLRYRVGVVTDDRQLQSVSDISFYNQLNPGQQDGDTLACICPLTLRNLLRTLWRMVGRRLHRRNAGVTRGEDAAHSG